MVSEGIPLVAISPPSIFSAEDIQCMLAVVVHYMSSTVAC